MILAKFKIVEGKGQKQRLNIRSSLRKLNEFKQAMQSERQPNTSSFVAMQNPLNKANIFESNEKTQEAFKFYLHYYYKKKQFTDIQIDKIFNMLNFLWRRFYIDYKNGKLPKELSDVINEENIFVIFRRNPYYATRVCTTFCPMQ
jgi:hypothetical protein